jgi:hypothetical protein
MHLWKQYICFVLEITDKTVNLISFSILMQVKYTIIYYIWIPQLDAAELSYVRNI